MRKNCFLLVWYRCYFLQSLTAYMLSCLYSWNVHRTIRHDLQFFWSWIELLCVSELICYCYFPCYSFDTWLRLDLMSPQLQFSIIYMKNILVRNFKWKKNHCNHVLLRCSYLQPWCTKIKSNDFDSNYRLNKTNEMDRATERRTDGGFLLYIFHRCAGNMTEFFLKEKISTTWRS